MTIESAKRAVLFSPDRDLVLRRPRISPFAYLSQYGPDFILFSLPAWPFPFEEILRR